MGQHFLHDSQVISEIVAAIGPAHDQHIVEIGPGLGAITVPLLRRLGKLNVIELDRDIIPQLQAMASNVGELIIHNADVLRFDITTIEPLDAPLRVVGNLPYNISTPLIFHLLESRSRILDMHFLLQKEVVDRLAASPGNGAYGRLSIMVQYHCRVERLFNVSNAAFTPPPRVISAFVRLTPHKVLPVIANDPQMFSRLVNAAFSKRRKTLKNALKGLLTESEIHALDIDPTNRPERLSTEQFVMLANHCAHIE